MARRPNLAPRKIFSRALKTAENRLAYPKKTNGAGMRRPNKGVSIWTVPLNTAGFVEVSGQATCSIYAEEGLLTSFSTASTGA